MPVLEKKDLYDCRMCLQERETLIGVEILLTVYTANLKKLYSSDIVLISIITTAIQCGKDMYLRDKTDETELFMIRKEKGLEFGD